MIMSFCSTHPLALRCGTGGSFLVCGVHHESCPRPRGEDLAEVKELLEIRVIKLLIGTMRGRCHWWA